MLYFITYLYIIALIGGFYGITLIEKKNRDVKTPSMFSLEFYVCCDESSRKAVLGIVISLSIIIGFLIYSNVVYNNANVWEDWIPDEKDVIESYTETTYMNDLYRTKANFWSNLFYMVVGVYAVNVGYQDRLAIKSDPNLLRSFVKANPHLSVLFGLANIQLSIGSGLFHASLTMFGRQLDVAAMYSPLLVYIAISLGRWYPRLKLSSGENSIPTWPFFSFAIFVIAVMFFVYKWQMDSAIVLPLLILISFGLAGMDRMYYPNRLLVLRWFLMAFCILLVGVACRETDVAGLFAEPDSWFQGHSIWHFCTATSLYWMYLHHRSEPVVSDKLPHY